MVRGYLFAAVPLVLWACGPSVQSIYEGNVRFEHCYRLDLDLSIAPSHREACWRQWLRTYTYGQPRDRTEYARHRIRAFLAGDVSRPTLNLGSEPSSGERRFYLVAPDPTSAHAPPPPMATRVYVDDERAPATSAKASVPAAPAARCSADCETSYRSCQAACTAGGGTSETVCQSCDPDYKACMKRCFE